MNSGSLYYPLLSEEEEAERLNITIPDLLLGIRFFKLSYSVHEKASGSGFQFTEYMTQYNLELLNCSRSGGHFFELQGFRDEGQTIGIYKCRLCPAKKYH